MRLEPQFFETLAHAKAGHAAFHQQQTGAFGAGRGVGLGHHNHHIGVPAVGDKGFAALEQVAAIGLNRGRGFDALQIRPGGRLAHGDGANHFAAGHARQVAGFLLRRAVVGDIGCHDFAVQAVADARKARPPQLFHLHNRIQLVGTRAAELLWHGHAQKAVLARLVPHCAVHIALLFPLGMERCNFLVHKAAKAVAEGIVLSGKKGSVNHGEELSGCRSGDKRAIFAKRLLG